MLIKLEVTYALSGDVHAREGEVLDEEGVELA